MDGIRGFSGLLFAWYICSVVVGKGWMSAGLLSSGDSLGSFCQTMFGWVVVGGTQ